jgi:hypothetical protein
MTAVRTASARSVAPEEAPPLLISPAHVAVGDLVAAEVDRVVGRQLRVDERAGLPVARPERVVAAVVLGHLLLDDVGLDRHAEVVGLAGEVGG